MSERTSERCERTSERTSEWPSTYVPILGSSAPLCSDLAVCERGGHVQVPDAYFASRAVGLGVGFGG